ncbi:ABC transporter permease [Streptomyces sp. SCSIO ZS0520]|uniref:ABC transporter permease n=1 Tax=Streptomyces sp. SCSIO ZS0520 TaxID=2892996 RepID=UPI0021DAF13F|nr:ABC transporter permease [Streptomyces sp. SCSIO ZS0520]
MSPLAAAHSEWLKIRSVRASWGSLLAIFGVPSAVTVLVHATAGGAEDADPLFGAFFALVFGQIAALCFGATAAGAEYRNGALRVSLAAVPRRGLLYGAKTAVILGAALLTGLVTGFLSFLAGQAFLGSEALTLGDPGVLRACVGAGIQLALMALLAAGLTVLLRSAVAVLSLLIPFLLIVSFVVGDIAGGAAAYLPDRAGQQVLHAHPEGPLGAWQGLAVCAAWAALATLAGWWAIRRRDA